MRRLVGNPWLGLVSLGLYVLAIVLGDALNSAAEAGQDIPAALASVLRATGVVCILGVVIAQRHARLPQVWRTANTLVLLLLAVQVWVVISMWGLPATSAKAGPRETSLLLAFVLSLGVALAPLRDTPLDPPRDGRSGLTAAALIAVPGFLGLVISSRFSSSGPRPFEPVIVLVSAMVASFVIPFAYEFGSRLRRSGPEPRP
ncbi:MAG: hypothetical protein AAFS11_01250 [Planctomycetota bacterium]